MLLFPIKFPRERRRNRPAASALGPPVGTVTVIEVIADGSTTLVWNFSSDIAAAGANCPQLQANDGGGEGGWASAVAVEFGGGSTLIVTYDGTSLEGGSLYRVVAAPEDLTFVDGTMALPQAGTIGE